MEKGMVIILLLAIAGFAYADAGETVHSIKLPAISVELKPGDGRETISRLCSICHSLDYIAMQPAFSKAGWTAEVNKMIKVMGAPVGEEDAKVIINYLTTEYGTGK